MTLTDMAEDLRTCWQKDVRGVTILFNKNIVKSYADQYNAIEELREELRDLKRKAGALGNLSCPVRDLSTA